MMTEKQKPITENSMKKLFANFTAQFKEEMISLLDELLSKKLENLWQEKLLRNQGSGTGNRRNSKKSNIYF